MSELYSVISKNEKGVFGDSELSNDFVQKTILENKTNKTGKTNYVIRFSEKNEKKEKKGLLVEKKITLPKTSKKSVVKKESSFEDVITGKFENMMTQFQNMVQLSQLIQMNQMNQIQIMNQLLELKTSVIDTRQDLGVRLKEINQRIDEVAAKKASGGRSKKEVIQEIVQEEEGDLLHLVPLKKETILSMYEMKDIDEEFIISVLKGKNINGFMKIFDLLYKSEDSSKKDIYPIRMIKARTFQYLNENRKWIVDTNGTMIISIIQNNLDLLLSKINNDYYQDDMNQFIDHQNFIVELNDKSVKSQIINFIKDSIQNHMSNHS